MTQQPQTQNSIVKPVAQNSTGEYARSQNSMVQLNSTQQHNGSTGIPSDTITHAGNGATAATYGVVQSHKATSNGY